MNVFLYFVMLFCLKVPFPAMAAVEKLSENIAKPKELWQTLKSLGLPNKKNSSSNICLKNKNGLLFD